MHEETKLWNKSYIMILILSTVINSATQMVTPLVSKFAISLGAQLSIATTIASLMSWSALFLRPFAGLLSDRFNRKKIILISNLAIAVCLLLMSGAKTVTTLVAIRILHGIAFSFNSVAMMAFNTMYIPKDRLGEGMGWMALGTIVSQALGPNIGIALVEKTGYAACFAVAAAVCVVGVLIILMMHYEHPVSDKSRKLDINSLISLRILPYAAIMCLFSAGNGLASNMLVLFGDARGIANIGLFFTAYSIAMVVVRPFSGKLVDKKGLRFVLYPAIVLSSAAYFVLGSATALWMVILAAILKAVGQGSGQPGIQSTCLRQIGREKAGVVSSTCYIGQDIGNAVAPVIGGFVVERFGYTNLFYGYAVVLLVGASLIFFLKYNYDVKKYGDAA
ncbi:MAG: MFS transporter [Firmicutes bacterium]|nr:MFS transporter [Bacillota bacterium]